jgi:hypothetical protein
MQLPAKRSAFDEPLFPLPDGTIVGFAQGPLTLWWV